MRTLFLLLAILSGCDEATNPLAQRCDVYLSALAPDAALPGSQVLAHARPVTTTWDTVIYVGSTTAKVDALTRTDCTACDSCRAEENCSNCDACKACDDECRDTCVETVQFTVPEVTAGKHSVSMVNQHGHSTSLPFTVLDSPDTGGEDTAPPDSGEPPADSGDIPSP